jgi:hypothetical protein
MTYYAPHPLQADTVYLHHLLRTYGLDSADVPLTELQSWLRKQIADREQYEGTATPQEQTHDDKSTTEPI